MVKSRLIGEAQPPPQRHCCADGADEPEAVVRIEAPKDAVLPQLRYHHNRMRLTG